MICASGSVVEYRLAKARVAGSNPVSRFQKENEQCRFGIAHFLFFESDPGLEGSKSLLRSARVFVPGYFEVESSCQGMLAPMQVDCSWFS